MTCIYRPWKFLPNVSNVKLPVWGIFQCAFLSITTSNIECGTWNIANINIWHTSFYLDNFYTFVRNAKAKNAKHSSQMPVIVLIATRETSLVDLPHGTHWLLMCLVNYIHYIIIKCHLSDPSHIYTRHNIYCIVL